MRILFASDSFKGSLSSSDISYLLKKAAEAVYPEAECTGIPVADGGEGTVDAVVKACKGHTVELKVHDPLMRIIDSYYSVINGDTAVIEMSLASGLTLLKDDERDPRLTSTYGTGELILDALNKGFHRIYMTIGGSATNDGGMGCMRALGAAFLDRYSNVLDGCGKDLLSVERIDMSGFDGRISECDFTVMCDVKNPLTGDYGASMIFSSQKGADEKTKNELESGMVSYRNVIKRQFSVDCDDIEGAGAAGGLGAALSVFCKGEMRPGIDAVLDIIDFDSLLDRTDLVITGEGRLDSQSLMGKVIGGVSRRAGERRIPVYALCGSVKDDFKEYDRLGLESVYSLINSDEDTEYAMKNARRLYFDAAVKMFKKIKERYV